MPSSIFTSDLILIYIGVFLSWLIFVLGIAQISRIHAHVAKIRKDVDTSLSGMAQLMQKNQSIMAEMLKEQRRSSRLLAELSDLKRAEMTGSYEIVEEPVPQQTED